jgi:hypothetical protein
MARMWSIIFPFGRIRRKNANPEGPTQKPFESGRYLTTQGSYTAALVFVASDAARVIVQGIIHVSDKDIPDLTLDVQGRSVTVLGLPAETPPGRPPRW